ncbi:hypothetical protein AB0B45_50835 [Nonomuraea sp. NPDC049152]|uniref:hypothetical protein n=1 Tax=Nonomuraea sp. NPDC049152 TaxID=3154350 RepID=UPI0034003AC7
MSVTSFSSAVLRSAAPRTVLVTTAGLTALLLSTSAATASADHSAAMAYGCSGDLVGTWPVPMKDLLTGGTYYRSDIKLFYNSRTGWNCAVLVKRPGKPRYGVRTPMAIEMYNGTWADDNLKKRNYDQDSGRFKYHAGPVRVYGKYMCVGIVARHDDSEGPDNGEYNGYRKVDGVACR